MNRKNNGEGTGIQLSSRVSGSDSDSQDCYKLKKRRGGERGRVGEGREERRKRKERGRERRKRRREKKSFSYC